MSSHKISILGTGNMGRAIGLRLAGANHTVYFGGRNPSDAPTRAAQKAPPHTAFAGTLDDAARFGDVLIWTPRARSPGDIFAPSFDAKTLTGKIIIDLNNRDYANDVAGPSPKFFEKSLGEELQENFPEARVVKAWNTVAMETLDTSVEKLREVGAQIFVAGADKEARDTVAAIGKDLGFESVDLGGGGTAMRMAEALGDAVRWLMFEGVDGFNINIGIRKMPEPDLGLVGGREESQYH